MAKTSSHCYSFSLTMMKWPAKIKRDFRLGKFNIFTTTKKIKKMTFFSVAHFIRHFLVSVKLVKHIFEIKSPEIFFSIIWHILPLFDSWKWFSLPCLSAMIKRKTFFVKIIFFKLLFYCFFLHSFHLRKL